MAPARAGVLRSATLATVAVALMTVAAAAMLAASVVTLFRARRFCQEVIARWLGKAVLRVIGVRLVVHQERPFPRTQTIYVANHTSGLDMFILVALRLPNTRFFLKGAAWRVLPLGIVGFLIGTFFTPPQSKPAERAKCFQRAERVLRRTGDSVFLSPEGTRVTTGEIGRFNKGTFHLATNLHLPIVPLYIQIPREIDPGKGFAALPGTVHVWVSPAIDTSHWRIEDLEHNKDRVRDFYVTFQQALRSKAAAAPGEST